MSEVGLRLIRLSSGAWRAVTLSAHRGQGEWRSLLPRAPAPEITGIPAGFPEPVSRAQGPRQGSKEPWWQAGVRAASGPPPHPASAQGQVPRRLHVHHEDVCVQGLTSGSQVVLDSETFFFTLYVKRGNTPKPSSGMVVTQRPSGPSVCPNVLLVSLGGMACSFRGDGAEFCKLGYSTSTLWSCRKAVCRPWINMGQLSVLGRGRPAGDRRARPPQHGHLCD